MSNRWARTAAVVVALISGAGCAASVSDGPATTQTPRVAETDGTATPVIEQRRIVPLGGDITEVVFALGLGGDVVAIDLSTTFPSEALGLPKIGFERALNAEPILAVEPTDIVATDAAGPESTLAELARVGVPVTVIEREYSSTGPARKIREVAAALDVSDEGDRVADEVQAQIDAATVDPSVYSRPMRVVALYLRGDDLQFVLGAGAGAHWVIEAAGAVDIADGLGVVETAPITIEAILAAAPDAIIVPESGLVSAGGVDALLAVPGVAETPAGRSGAIYAYDDQLMLGNGPRTPEFLRQLVADLHDLDARCPDVPCPPREAQP
ncbi:MAG: ABC transporter substrate-binding protein [Ilumatobacteraceae bacterium]